MTGHQDRPDIRQRRRVTRLRTELGLISVPPHVGTELRTIAPRVSEHVARVLRHDPAYAALSSRGQTRLISALALAVDEFARLVEDRPPQAQPVEAMLIEFVHVEDQLELCRAGLHAAFQTLREVTHLLWPQLPRAQAHSSHLDAAVLVYAKRLCAKTMSSPRAPSAGAPGVRRAGEPHLDGLLALVEHRWGSQPVQLYVSVSTLAGGDAPTLRTPPSRDTFRQNVTHRLRLVTNDYVVSIAQHPVTPPAPASRPAGAARSRVTVCVGPVPASGVAVVHDIALLLLRLIQAGVAAPPSPVLIHAPNLGFLHPSPGEGSVRKITDLLLPLTTQGSHRRSALARTLQLCLRTSTTAQGLANQLACTPQTVHNHIAALRGLYNSDLNFADDNLAMQAALNLVLPLWDLEATGRASG